MHVTSCNVGFVVLYDREARFAKCDLADSPFTSIWVSFLVANGGFVMIFKRFAANLRAQNWTAIAIEVVIVVVGVFIGTQVSNWNAGRIERAETQRMLVQLTPELESQLEYFDSARTYYGVTRRYADIAFRGWRGEAGVSDEQFVIAAYQASQIQGIGINDESWSLTFGGDQLRNIADPEIRRLMELVMTADYSPANFTALQTPYREQVRRVIPIAIQDAIRRVCGDRSIRGSDRSFIAVLPPTCPLRIAPMDAAEAARALRSRPDLVSELRWHVAAVTAYIAFFETLETPIRELHALLAGKAGARKSAALAPGKPKDSGAQAIATLRLPA